MTKNEIELLKIINESASPAKVAEYMLNLFSDYLRTHAPIQETKLAALPEQA